MHLLLKKIVSLEYRYQIMKKIMFVGFLGQGTSQATHRFIQLFCKCGCE